MRSHRDHLDQGSKEVFVIKAATNRTTSMRSLVTGFLLVGSGLAGCATGPSRASIPPGASVIDVPMVTQTDANECGLASMAALAAYYGVSIPPEESARLRAIAQREEGLSGAEIRDALIASGLRAEIVTGTLDRSPPGIYRQLDLGRPLLVMADRRKDVLHASLLVGHDPANGNLLHLDPLRGTVWESPERFEAAWAKAGNFLLLATPAETLDSHEAQALDELASSTSPELEAQRAGDVSNSDLTTVLLVLGIVVLVVILV
jgi:ABC-type bacteriocin/lantibiotic exporter with double-glycine peptidase domain